MLFETLPIQLKGHTPKDHVPKFPEYWLSLRKYKTFRTLLICVLCFAENSMSFICVHCYLCFLTGNLSQNDKNVSNIFRIIIYYLQMTKKVLGLFLSFGKNLSRFLV